MRKVISVGRAEDSSDDPDEESGLNDDRNTAEASNLIADFNYSQTMERNTAQSANTRWLSSFYALAAGLSALLVVLLVTWALHFRNGFAWHSKPSREFNWHPFLMVSSLVVLYGHGMRDHLFIHLFGEYFHRFQRISQVFTSEILSRRRIAGILVYRLLRNEPKKKLKIIHAALMIVALVLASVGLKAVFDSHNYAAKPTPNLYSLHSWVGLAAVILFAAQVLYRYQSVYAQYISRSIYCFRFIGKWQGAEGEEGKEKS